MELQNILNQYNNGCLTLTEMQDNVYKIGHYLGYKMQYGKRSLKAMINGCFVQVECNCITQ